MSVQEVFLIKENGIYLAHAGDSSDYCDDLRSSMITAMDFGVNEVFKGKIKCVLLEDGKRVIYHHRAFIYDDENKPSINFTLITVLDDAFTDFEMLEMLVDDFCNFLLEDDIFNFLSMSNHLKDDGNGQIDILTSKMQDLFSVGVSLAVSR